MFTGEGGLGGYLTQMEKRKYRRKASSMGPTIKREESSNENDLISMLPDYLPDGDGGAESSDTEATNQYEPGKETNRLLRSV